MNEILKYTKTPPPSGRDIVLERIRWDAVLEWNEYYTRI